MTLDYDLSFDHFEPLHSLLAPELRQGKWVGQVAAVSSASCSRNSLSHYLFGPVAEKKKEHKRLEEMVRRQENRERSHTCAAIRAHLLPIEA